MEMSEYPVTIKEHLGNLQCNGRPPLDESKLKGQKHIITRGYRSDKDRIKRAVLNNSFIDSGAPSFGRLQLRPREECKEIN